MQKLQRNLFSNGEDRSKRITPAETELKIIERRDRRRYGNTMRNLKRVLLAVVVLVAGCALQELGTAAPKKPTYESQAKASVGALFYGNDFHCSGSVIGENGKQEALFLTARHCVVNQEQLIEKGYYVTFADNEKGPWYGAEVYLVSQTDDVAILTLINGRGLPAVKIGDENKLAAGDRIVDISFALDSGKMVIYGDFIAPRYAHLPDEIAQFMPIWKNSMPMNITAGPGASGSGIFDPQQRALIGILVGAYPGAGSLTIGIPATQIIDTLNHPKENSVESWKAANKKSSQGSDSPEE